MFFPLVFGGDIDEIKYAFGTHYLSIANFPWPPPFVLVALYSEKRSCG